MDISLSKGLQGGLRLVFERSQEGCVGVVRVLMDWVWLVLMIFNDKSNKRPFIIGYWAG